MIYHNFCKIILQTIVTVFLISGEWERDSSFILELKLWNGLLNHLPLFKGGTIVFGKIKRLILSYICDVWFGPYSVMEKKEKREMWGAYITILFK